jgi:glycosyltransferase involved in cell wall biosynthesis
MASAAVELLRNRAKWTAMSDAAARDARERFGMDDVVERYEALYKATIG